MKPVVPEARRLIREKWGRIDGDDLQAKDEKIDFTQQFVSANTHQLLGCQSSAVTVDFIGFCERS